MTTDTKNRPGVGNEAAQEAEKGSNGSYTKHRFIDTLSDEEKAAYEQQRERRARESLPPVLPDDFWEARGYLKHIKQAALSRMTSPDAFLGCALARAAASMSSGYRLPAIVGSVSGLQTYVAQIGPSGAGKSSSFSETKDLIDWTPFDAPLYEISGGSGEGLVEAYFGMVQQEPEEGEKKGKAIKQQVRYNVLVNVDEGAAVLQRATRNGGDTWFSTIRSMWTGGAVGEHNATEDRKRALPAGKYALGLVISFQPEVIGPMLADVGTGTPQRFLCVSALHPGITADPPEHPGKLERPQIDNTIIRDHLSGNALSTFFGVHQDIQKEIRQQRLAHVRGEAVISEMDSHRNLMKLKVAAILAYFDSRLDISVEDWDLAEQIVSTSGGVRSWAQKQVQTSERKRNEAHAKKLIQREDFIENHTIHEAAKRITEIVCKTPEGINRKNVRSNLSSKQRMQWGPALDYAIGANWVTDEDSVLKPGDDKP